jgi:ABC-type cobalamin/Fe3+-siderophores transport system ATPase subunit
MLKTFKVRNFRLLEALEIHNLRRVNLLVGQNNSGKSSFLEAIELYAKQGEPKTLLKLLNQRQEDWLGGYFVPDPEDSLRYLFSNWELPKPGKFGIILGEINSDDQLHFKFMAYHTQKSPEGLRQRSYSDLENLEIHAPLDVGVGVVLAVEKGNQIIPLLDTNEQRKTIIRHSRFFRFVKELSESKIKLQSVSTKNMSIQKLAALWDLMSLTQLEDEVIQGLRLIDERVSGITFVEYVGQNNSKKSARIPLVKLEGISKRLPLKAMGDGIYRLFQILVALVNAENGILLIDEFENGLHWTVQAKVWEAIFKLSHRLNVQVFATTHSRDCVESFQEIWEQHQDDGAFFRLDIRKNQVKATEYPLDTLSDAVETNVEVR